MAAVPGRQAGPRPARVDDHLRLPGARRARAGRPRHRLPRHPPRARGGCSRERFGLDHTTLQVDHEGGELLQIETRRRRRWRSRSARDGYEIDDDRDRLDVDAIWGYPARAPTGRRTSRARSSSVDRGLALPRPLRARRRAGRVRAGGHRRGHLRLDRRRFVLEPHRGRGLGVWLVETLLAPPASCRGCASVTAGHRATPTASTSASASSRDRRAADGRAVVSPERALRQPGGEAHRVDLDPGARPRGAARWRSWRGCIARS